MRIDCSKTLNYVAERNRMCNTLEKKGNSILKCKVCPLHIENCECGMTRDITQKHIDIVQKWSDEHPQETMVDKLFEIFPNAMKLKNGLPLFCPHYLGWGEYEKCPKGQGVYISCVDCWNMPYIEK